MFYPSMVRIMEWDGSTWYTRAQANLTTQQGQWYDVVAKLNGTSVVIERRVKGGEFSEVLSGTVNMTTTTLLQFYVPAYAVFRIDDIMVIDGTMKSTYTMTYNNANELTQMANSTQGTTVAFTYDAWGRTASQTVGSKSATYAYKYGSKLASVTSTLFGEANVAFEYGGDQKRRSMTSGGITKQYNWDMGWNVINEEDGNGALARSYTHNPQYAGRATLAHVDGTNPATGAYRYYLHDHLGSTRFVFSHDVDLLATYQYTPYGDLLASNNPNTTTHLFTGHDWNPASNFYFAPFRYYNPATARWLMRDPLGMANGPNVYVYVGGRPCIVIDPYGLSWWWPPSWNWRAVGRGVNRWAPKILIGGGVIVGLVGFATVGWEGAAVGSVITGVGALWEIFNAPDDIERFRRAPIFNNHGDCLDNESSP